MNIWATLKNFHWRIVLIFITFPTGKGLLSSCKWRKLWICEFATIVKGRSKFTWFLQGGGAKLLRCSLRPSFHFSKDFCYPLCTKFATITVTFSWIYISASDKTKKFWYENSNFQPFCWMTFVLQISEKYSFTW